MFKLLQTSEAAVLTSIDQLQSDATAAGTEDSHLIDPRVQARKDIAGAKALA